ncbi:CoA-binding protein [candidate division KSB1 bacterium]|nr:CoA-binding protein [candidate division KSB1 bacterium]
MIAKQIVDEFLAQRQLAVIGVSRDPKKFGNKIFRALKLRGYEVFPINSQATVIEGERCYSSLSVVPQNMDGAIFVVPPVETEKVLPLAAKMGIPRVWLQPGSASASAVQFCEAQNLAVIHDECILMFLEPVSLMHRFHRWLRGLRGKLPR